MTRHLAVGMWAIGAIADLLSWSTLSSSERGFHVMLILMFGAVVFAVIGRSPRAANTPADQQDR